MTPQEMEIRRVAEDVVSRPEHFGYPVGTTVDEVEKSIVNQIKRLGQQIAEEFPHGIHTVGDFLRAKQIAEGLFPWNQNLPAVRHE